MSAILKKINNFIPINPIIFDIGADVGTNSIIFSQIWPNASIYAFEPQPIKYSKLAKRTSNSKNITIYPIAIGDCKGYIDFYASSNATESIKISKYTLDDWATNNNIEKIDFLNINLLGAESYLFKGANKLISTVRLLRTDKIRNEHSKYPFYIGAKTFNNVGEYLIQFGFKLIYESNLYPCETIFYKY